MTTVAAPCVELIPIDRITIINSRHRSKRSCRDMRDSLSAVGLKQPITVARRTDGELPRYDLVCGQGRLEAYQGLAETHIPALVIEADVAECLLKSLVENIARRKASALEIFHDIGAMQVRGYSYAQIARKTGLNYDYVLAIAHLVEHGEHRLLKAVERGQIPINVAMVIAEADDEALQHALQEAYDKGELRGQSLLAARQVATRRRQGGKDTRSGPAPKKVSSGDVVRDYQRDIDRKRLLIDRANQTRDRLLFVIEALRTLLADDNFANLMQVEGLDSLPRKLAERIQPAMVLP